MKPLRRRRLLLISAMLLALALSSGLVLYALRQNINLFYTPSQVISGEVSTHRHFRIGGMVVPKSIKRSSDGLTVSFAVTDTAHDVVIQYHGVLPDLFREGQGIVAEGRLTDATHFKADRVLAKHDEKYMPPEVRFAVKKAHAT